LRGIGGWRRRAKFLLRKTWMAQNAQKKGHTQAHGKNLPTIRPHFALDGIHHRLELLEYFVESNGKRVTGQVSFWVSRCTGRCHFNRYRRQISIIAKRSGCVGISALVDSRTGIV